MRFCTHCGKELVPGDSFCRNCGSRIDNPVVPGTGKAAGKSFSGGPVRKKGHKKVIIPLVILVVLALGAGTVFGFPYVKTAVTKAIIPPEKYFNNTIDKNIGSLAEKISALTERTRESNPKGKGFDSSAEIVFGDGFVNYFEDLSGDDLSEIRETIDWVKSAKITASQSSDDVNFDLNAALSVNDSDVISCNAMMNMDSKELYFTIPELNPTAIRMTAEDIGLYDSDMEGISNAYDALDAVPEKEVVKDLIHDYVMTAVDEIKNVEKSNQEISVGGISKEYTTYTAQIDTQTYRNIVTAVLNKARGDEALANVIKNFASRIGYDANDAYNDFIDAIDDTLRDGINDSTLDSPIRLTLFVDGKGGVAGISIKDDHNEIRFVNVIDGTSFANEYVMDIDGEPLRLDGSGKLNGTKCDGNYKISFDGEDMASFAIEDVNALKLKDGYFEGTVTLSAGSAIRDELDSENLGRLAQSQIRYTCTQASKDKSVSSVALVDGGSDVIAINIDSTRTDGAQPGQPPMDYISADDYDRMDDWAYNCDVNKLIDNLEAAGAQGEWVSELRDAIN